MDDHFAAFSFVDRITELTPGVRARGRFAVPAGLATFSPCLVAEAVGQLGAWVAMAQLGFRGRPVAALAHETRFLRDVAPGDALDLAVEIDSCDDEVVTYHGWAEVGGIRVIELNDCLGPMLPVAEFDAPEALSARFDLLRGKGAEPGHFRGVETPRVVPQHTAVGEAATALLYVPAAAPFFNDHFPRRPVFPATLLLNEQIRLALSLAGTRPHWPAGTALAPLRMTDVKVRSFTPPGQVLEIGAELAAPVAGTAVGALSARADGKVVATSRVEIGLRAG
jgi:3-hydroxymyristoyl/3-hydroxydecanoyl-(acyl carrier protein) dehydratase